MRKTGRVRGAWAGALALLILSLAAGAQAADWRFFGVDSLSGYLALKSESSQEQQYDVRIDRFSVEQLARLRVGSYMFHPRFLSLAADTTLAVRSGSAADSGLRNVDSGLALDFLPQHFLSFGLSGRSKVENLERDFTDYQRRTVGGSAYASLRGGLLPNTSFKYETAEAKSEGAFPEDRLTRHLSAESSLRLASFDKLSILYRAVQVDDRLAQDSFYHTAEVSGGRSVLDNRGKLNLGLTAWEAQRPQAERRLTLRESWQTDWNKRLRTLEEAELTRRTYLGVDTNTYKANLDVTQALSDAWHLSGGVNGTSNSSVDREASSVYRARGGIGYKADWGNYQVVATSDLSLTHTLTDTSRRVSVFGELRELPLTLGSERLTYPNVVEILKVYEPGQPATDWTDFCDVTTEGGVTRLRWKTEMADDQDYPDIPPGADAITVAVDYVYELPDTRYSELRGNAGARLSREFRPGLGAEATLTVNSTSPLADASNSMPSETSYELGTQGFYKRNGNEAAAGVTAGDDRRALFLRGTAFWKGWTFHESYRAEFYSEREGQFLDVKVNRLWGINEKTHVNFEVSDQMQTANGDLNLGLTAAKVKGSMLFNPFMRVEVEGRGEVNRAVTDDTRMALDAKYIWQQGLLDLTVGLELRRRTFDEYTGHRLFATLIRKF